MSASETRAAAERIRQAQEHGCYVGPSMHKDHQLLAETYLASHPSDGPSDSEILDWLEQRAFTAYRGRDPESGKLEKHTVVVNEDAHRDHSGRRGILGKTLRDAIRQAMKGASE